AIPAELMESEMFGYVHGAFSGALKGGRPGKFELADGGTLLLDEIGDMPHNMQVKLLRVLQTGEIQRIGSTSYKKVNVRVIAATNVDLLQAIQKKKFRQDLYYRLNILPITIPPLRDRGKFDIQTLASHFINKYNPRCSLNPESVELLSGYDWPGNVRELENTIQQAIHLCDGQKLTPEQLNLPYFTENNRSCPKGAIRDMEKDMILSTLEQNGFNMVKAATLLGISRATLYRKIKQFGISRPS
ncbi:MAG: sigma 54-interacting transcriptional regulator, partial [Desulfobacterales bacterium]|nr:sigma 54-interacting transcriptional regulator [Desulfobacterales bacterium]